MLHNFWNMRKLRQKLSNTKEFEDIFTKDESLTHLLTKVFEEQPRLNQIGYLKGLNDLADLKDQCSLDKWTSFDNFDRSWHSCILFSRIQKDLS